MFKNLDIDKKDCRGQSFDNANTRRVQKVTMQGVGKIEKNFY